MKLGLLVVLAVAVLAPSLSESRLVPKCELKTLLCDEISLPVKLEKHREKILEYLTYSFFRKSRLYTSVVFSKRVKRTTAAKKTTVIITLPTLRSTENSTQEMTSGSSTTKLMITNSTSGTSTTKFMTTNSTSGTNSTDDHRRKREADAAMSYEDEEQDSEEEEDSVEDSEVSEDEEEDNEGDKEDSVEEEEVTEDEEQDSEEEEDSVEDSEVSEDEEEDSEEEEESMDDSQEEEEEGSEDKEDGKRKKRGLHRKIPIWKLKLRRRLRRRSRFLYGVLQLSNTYFCKTDFRWSANKCNTSCKAFIDDDISDDVACFVKTRNKKYWRAVVRRALRSKAARGFLKDCE
ncbi:YTH domain-containing protein 1-like [Stegastes partitus]|uniref:YTH domain-containing protein 1-like n=1 Tax=Stegastes partitus TaxID=144197 RepID=A0A9Y4JXK3_9TELE|nr:PREDICTED: YTH domain-containing protein 1-like [Stegastes partitus]